MQRAAKVALIVLVPVACVNLWFGSHFGILVTELQPMKISASEAQWDTCQPCAFSLFQIGGFHAERPDAELLDPDPQAALVPRHRLVQRPGGRPERAEQAVRSRSTGGGATTCHRPGDLLVACAGWRTSGSIVALVASWAPSSTGGASSSSTAGSSGLQSSRMRFLPFVASAFGWVPDRVRAPAVDRAGPAEDRRCELASVSTTWIAISLAVFVSLYVALARARHRADAPLRRDRSAPGAGEAGGDAAAGGGLLMAPRWICRPSGSSSSPSSGAGTSCSRASTSASACCCRSCRANESERRSDVPDDRPRLGRERGMARRRRRRDVRGVPDLVRDDVLGLLHRPAARSLLPDHPRGLVRVALEEREPALADGLALGERGRQLRRIADLGRRARQPPLRRPDQLERRFHAADFWDLFSGYTVLAGVAVVLALRLPRSDVPDAADDGRAVRAGEPEPPGGCSSRRRPSARPSSSGRSWWPSTGTTRTCSRRSLPAAIAIAALVLAVALRLREASGWAFAMTATRRRARGGDALHEPLPAGDGLEH